MTFTSASPGCGDDAVGGVEGVCEAPEDRPADPSKPAWSHSGADDGPENWGEIPGYELCGTGNEQTPIDIPTGGAVPTVEALEFEGYEGTIPLVLLNNGHTLQVNYEQRGGDADPRISYAGKTYRLLQMHGHSTSEHTVDGRSYGYELHLVHQADDMTLAVVGIFFESGAEDATVRALLANDPGPFLETTCAQEVDLRAVLPERRGFYHYNGSLTTPGCNEGVSWFVMKEARTISDEQVAAYQQTFGGTTNRPVKPLGGRTILVSDP